MRTYQQRTLTSSPGDVFFKARWHKDQAVSAHETHPKPAVRPASRRGLGMGHVMIFTGKDVHIYIYMYR